MITNKLPFKVAQGLAMHKSLEKFIQEVLALFTIVFKYYHHILILYKEVRDNQERRKEMLEIYKAQAK